MSVVRHGRAPGAAGGKPAGAHTIVVDAMGGDRAPREPVAGAVVAAREHDVPVTLVGQSGEIEPLLAECGAIGEIPVLHAEEALAMDAGALASWRRPRSSVAVACQAIRHGEAGALVSAGSTAGIVATTRLRLRSLAGVPRPALAVVLPTRPRKTVLLDAGATADAKPEMLVQFAHLGIAYAQLAFGVHRPRVALLTIGEEPGKGDRLTRRGHDLLAAAPIEFTGNIEGDDLLAGRVDVVVTNGFTGNVALKTLEGSIRFATAEITDILTSTPLAKTGSLLYRRRLRDLYRRLDTEAHGGAALLGLNGTVVIAHGSATARAVTSACLLARDLSHGDISERIRERVGGGERHISLRRR